MSEEIKAKIVIEADTSGATEAAAALEKLQGIAGDGSIGDALAKQFEAGNEAAGGFTEALGGTEEALKANEEAVGGATSAMEDHQQAIEDTASAYEGLQEPVENVNKGLASMQETLTKSTPVVSQAAENMSAFQDAMVNPEPFNTVQQYLSETGQTWSDFIDTVGPENANRLVNMQNNLNGISNGFAEVNKSAGATTDTISSTQSAMDEFNQADPWASFNAGAQGASKSVEQVDSAINKFGGIGASQYGPLTLSDTLAKNWGLAGNEAEKALAQMGGAEGSVGGVFSSALGDIGGAFTGISSMVMPLMALQMVGTVVAQVGQSIYDAAAIAEGPAAHSMGTFTGTVDAITQSAQQAGQAFSENFGQKILPTLNAINYQMNQGGGAGGTGGILGSMFSDIANNALVIGGLISMTTPGGQGIGWDMIKTGGEGMINQYAQAFGFQQPFQGPGPQSQMQIDYQQQLAQTTQSVTKSAYQSEESANTLIAQGLDTNYLQQQDYLGAAQQFYQRQQASYNATHYISPRQAALDYQNQQQMSADQAAYQQYLSSGGTPITPDNPYGTGGGPSGSGSFLLGPGRGIDFGGAGKFLWDITGGGIGQTLNSIGSWLGSLFSGGGDGSGAGGFFTTGGCFVAGTLVLMADNSEKPIEQIQQNEQVIGHNGTQQEPVIVLSCITFLRKQTYELTFDDGNTLVTTDSHPLYSPGQGWKSLSPASTKRENPHLPVSTLQIGDTIATTQGTCTLVTIEEKQITQVYNISVSGSHTYYANGILVHNPKQGASMGAQPIDLGGGFQLPHIDLGAIGSSLASQFSGIQLPHLDLGNIASSLGGAFSGIQLPHLDLGNIGSTLAGAFSGITLPHLDLGGIGSALSGAFSGITLPHIPDLGGMINGALGGVFSGITMPHIPDIGGMINGALGGMFSGITLPPMPDIGGMISGALGGMFSGITLPAIPDLGGMINGALGGMFSGISLPAIPNIGAMINGALGGMFAGITAPPPPDVGAMINGAMGGIFNGIHVPAPPDVGAMISGAMSGMFAGITLPAIPDLGAMINGALGGIFSGIHIPSIPGFAAGIEGFSGGLAMVGEAGPELVMLPGGSSVYPLSNGAPIGGNAGPISFSGGGGGGPHTANITVNLDSQTLISLMGASLMSSINIGMGKRSY